LETKKGARASDQAYEQLRVMIIDLRLRPGMIVDELSLAAEIGLGRTPVHEAVARLVMAAEDAREETNVLHFLEDDQRIHRFLAHMVRNLFLRDAADRILLHNLRFWRFYFTTRHAQPGTLVSHQPLLAALERRDAQGAFIAMREHILASRALLNELF